MRAIVTTTPGGPDVLQWQEVPDPQPGAGEVLLDVAASAVNRADMLQRQGHYDPPPGVSPYLGLECSGTIAALGPDVDAWEVGDQVCALLAGGGYAERVAVPASQLLPIPKGIDLVEAAGLPEVACTVFSTVFMVGGLRAGETFLVHGGGSGIGTFAIQLAKAAEVGKVLCTAGSQDKLDRCLTLGADVGIDYSSEDFVERVKAETDGAGADVILDIVGAKYLARNVAALAKSGRLAIIGLQGGRKAELDLGALLAKRAAVIGVTLRGRPLAEKAAIVAGVTENVWPLVESGQVRPVVDRTMPMAEAAAAHALMESSTHFGKILLATEG
ncbi:MAG: zinc-binding dehydrogenase [Streptosporangiales bacterium]|nr:zinc-binding dehydrogenase [Streptosporangiales bacterium]